MSHRSLLHKTKLDEFKQYLEDCDYVLLEPVGDYEVARWSAGKGRPMAIVFNRLSAKEHYTLNDAALPFFKRYRKAKRKGGIE